jgi:hypothetical protein
MNADIGLSGCDGTSDGDLEVACLNACITHLQWCVESACVKNNQLEIHGWALANAAPPEQASFLLNGLPFNHVRYPLPSPDLGEIFWHTPAAQNARFVCVANLETRQVYEGGFACLEFQDGSDAELVRQRAWYLPEQDNELPLPSGNQIRRVIGRPDRFAYQIGGATIFASSAESVG